jgi:hypothetical protein
MNGVLNMGPSMDPFWEMYLSAHGQLSIKRNSDGGAQTLII